MIGKIFIWILVAGSLPLSIFPCHASGAEGDELLGTKPPEWEVSDWFNSKPLRLRDLQGRPILVRFWTGPQCPYCQRSAPALNEFYQKFHSRGLEVIGFYHHKSSTPLDKKQVEKLIRRYGFRFPVAVDHNWETLRRWWLQGRPKAWTSISFLIDQEGVIRHVHPGGEYVKGDEAYRKLKAKIEEICGITR